MADATPRTDGWRASHRFARIAERKARLVVDLIRGKRCDQAIELLRFEHKRGARFVDKVLKSAMANANEQEAVMSKLFVREARVDPGPIIKRFQPKDRGRAHPIQKRTSHITIVVDEKG
jgi:large subunit ribosomal protein L22